MCSKAIYCSKNFLSYFFKQKNYVDYIQNGGAYMAEKLKIEKQMVESKPKLAVSKNLLDEFSNVDNKYAGTLDSLNKKRESLQTITPDFSSRAEAKLSDFKETNLGDIETDYQTDLQKINQNKAKKVEKSAKNVQVLTKNTEQKKIGLIEKALNSGWENSSIYENGIKKIDDETASELSVLNQQFSADMAAVNLQKTLLEIEKEKALKNFDLKYASKLEKQINSLKKEYAKTHDEKQIQAELDDTLNTIADVEDQKRLEKAKSLLNYVNGLKRQEALLFLNNNQTELVSQVGKSWFNSVQNWIKARS